MGKGFNNATRGFTNALGLTEDSSQRMNAGLSAAGQAVQQQVGQTALGQGPQLSAMQYQQALADSAMQQQAAANAARGVNPALAQRNAANAVSMAQAQAAQQAAILNEEERRRAQEVLLGQYQGERSTELGARQAGYTRLTNTLSAAGQAAMGGGKK